ncbi:preprotein translocase subunit SecY [Candidatus Poribacteria bacterium]|nr:preprotein translocase subunit SecY [Candidatus Poribacteria bacterium]MDE0687992.1 preprotein translocase subunit SecY [Candidatus Poribacteria bacterium]MXV84887.1 preprotein translocase subunit SecY [Candidatus Poribacteria bacterium]MYA54690.1 preprotein translocase subunit SecY [Candidatus Poribacteria bacterium]
MIKAVQNAFKIPELRKRIIFTALLLIVYRLGAHITLPGIDDQALEAFFQQLMERGGNVIGFIDLFSGGAFSQMTIFALGIQPYISASIIMQLLAVIVPSLEKLSKEPDGRKKITQYTRYGTVLLSIIQGITISIVLRNPENITGQAGEIVRNPDLWWHFLVVITLTAGTSFVMWLGEQITERGIGQGISLIITVGIVAGLPGGVTTVFNNLVTRPEFGILQLALLVALVVVAVMGTVFITLSVRKIPVQYGRQIRGRRVIGGQSTHLPLRVNAAGMIPIIFAVTLIQFPPTVLGFLPRDWGWVTGVETLIAPGTPLYLTVYALLIVGFTYFYTAVQINPIQMAEDLQKYGGFIPGIRAGKQTADYINTTLTRITLPGAVFLAAIAVIPIIITSQLQVGNMVEGASILIVVGVVLDTMSQIESYLTVRHYEGFLKDRKLKGRRR